MNRIFLCGFLVFCSGTVYGYGENEAAQQDADKMIQAWDCIDRAIVEPDPKGVLEPNCKDIAAFWNFLEQCSNIDSELKRDMWFIKGVLKFYGIHLSQDAAAAYELFKQTMFPSGENEACLFHRDALIMLANHFYDQEDEAMRKIRKSYKSFMDRMKLPQHIKGN
jgi:hypothetical protein